MKITINKSYTSIGQLPHIKDQIKEFRTSYSDEYILDAFISCIRENSKDLKLESNALYHVTTFGINTNGILCATAQAFAKEYSPDSIACYRVEMTVKNWDGYYEVQFYIDQDLAINLDPLLWSIKRYTEAA